jgi:hypothetical protein
MVGFLKIRLPWLKILMEVSVTKTTFWKVGFLANACGYESS